MAIAAPLAAGFRSTAGRVSAMTPGSLRHRSTKCSSDVTQSIEKDKRHGVARDVISGLGERETRASHAGVGRGRKKREPL